GDEQRCVGPGLRCPADGEEMPSVACRTPSVTASCLTVRLLVIDPPSSFPEIKAVDFSVARLHEPAHPVPCAQTPESLPGQHRIGSPGRGRLPHLAWV